ncbi:MFS transporter [Oscillospiraceae bacterium]|nr:MFS transporter [Oscillospiraceae bacterium]BDF76125.1 MFS transporter [Oscillospiraceae bacterium]
MKKDRLHFAWFVLLGVILIRGFAGGGLNTVSALFLPPVAAELGVGIGSLAIYLSITSVVMVFWLPIAGRIINKYDIRAVVLAGALLQAVSFAAFGRMNSVYGWYLLAVPYSMGATILANLLGPILINRWFAKNTGLMLGIQMAFVGLFGAVFQPVTSGLIARRGWRASYFILGIAVLAAVLIPGLLLLRDRPGDKGLAPYGQEEGPRAAQARPGGQLNVGQAAALRSLSFYLLLLFMIAITGVAVFSQHIPSYGGLLGYSLERTGTALALASVGSAIGSIAIGMVSDRIGALKTCYGVLGVGLVAILGFLLAGRGFALFALSTFLHGLTSSGIMVLAPILTLKFYGQQDYEKIYAKVSMGAPLASILLIPAYGFIYDHMGSYVPVLLGMLLLLLLALFSIAVGWKKRCTIDGCPGWRG